ncbi:MAG: SseB family protein [Candidatus Limnocylindria bacterium]
MTESLNPPAAASHDRTVPTGTLEQSAAALFEAMLAARDAKERGENEPPHAFYRALMSSTLLLPVPPGTQDEARSSLAAAVSDQDEVEIGVMLARDRSGSPISVVFGSGASLAAWSPTGTGSIALPARVVVGNLAASGLPAILDPAGPVPYRFAPDELRALSAGLIPGTDEPLAGRLETPHPSAPR